MQPTGTDDPSAYLLTPQCTTPFTRIELGLFRSLGMESPPVVRRAPLLRLMVAVLASAELNCDGTQLNDWLNFSLYSPNKLTRTPRFKVRRFVTFQLS